MLFISYGHASDIIYVYRRTERTGMDCNKTNRIRCSICGSIPDKIVKFKSDDASIVERYCDSCFERWTEGKDKVRLTATNGKDETIAAREKNSHLGD